jgi:hypothetical protein
MRDDDPLACDCLERHLFADDPHFPRRFERLLRRHRRVARLPMLSLAVAMVLVIAVPAVPLLLVPVELLLVPALVRASRRALRDGTPGERRSRGAGRGAGRGVGRLRRRARTEPI